ncbi:MAG: hypothetical protein R6U50_16595 [Desulfobacterales bacterium]
MLKIKHRSLLSLTIFFFVVSGMIASAHGQWGPPGGQQTPAEQYPDPFSSSPHQQQPYSPPAQPISPQSGGAQQLNDALGRFRLNLPSGTVPMGATYNFSVPAAMCQVSIMAVTQDQMFQMQQQNFPNMLRQMGGTIDAEQSMEVQGRPGRFITATMRDQNSGTAMHSMNVFISNGGIWVQVMGPEQNVQQISRIFNSVLAGLQF